MDAPGPGGLGGTFAGNPLSCTAALAVLAVTRARATGDPLHLILPMSATQEDYAEARRLYERLGFRITHEDDRDSTTRTSSAASVAHGSEEERMPARFEGVAVRKASPAGRV